MRLHVGTDSKPEICSRASSVARTRAAIGYSQVGNAANHTTSDGNRVGGLRGHRAQSQRRPGRRPRLGHPRRAIPDDHVAVDRGESGNRPQLRRIPLHVRPRSHAQQPPHRRVIHGSHEGLAIHRGRYAAPHIEIG